MELKVQQLKNLSEDKQKLDFKNKIMKQINVSLGESNNRPSIPGKNEVFGYTYQDQFGKKAIKNNPLKQYSGIINDSVGPGEYDPYEYIFIF